MGASSNPGGPATYEAKSPMTYHRLIERQLEGVRRGHDVRRRTLGAIAQTALGASTRYYNQASLGYRLPGE